jgi:hypothetical protein
VELPLLNFDHLVEEYSLRQMQRDHRPRWNQNLEMSSARVFGNHWSQLTLSWMLAPFPLKRKSERDTFLVDLGKLVENKIFQRLKLRSLRRGDGVDSQHLSSNGSGERRRMSWRRRARRGGRVTHTCRRHDLMESLYQVRSKRRMGECIRDLRKNQISSEKQESSILLIDLVLSFVSFGRILGEI